MLTTLSPQQRYDLVVRRMAEVNGGQAIKDIFAAGKTPKTFWATAPTGKPHIAYLSPLLKLAEMVKAGVDVSILFCDLYAFLVNHKQSMEVVAWRTKYYRFIFAAILDALGVPAGQVHFVDGSSHELTREFMIENYKLHALADIKDAQGAGSEYRKPGAKLSVLSAPVLPVLGEVYLDADFQFGGEDQREIFEFAERFIPQLGYRKRAHMMNAMIPGLSGDKMSASIPDSNIGILESPEVVHQKLERAVCKGMVPAKNGLLALCKEVLIPLCQFRKEESQGQHYSGQSTEANQEPSDKGALEATSSFSITVDSCEGQSEKPYTYYEKLEEDFESGVVSSGALKVAIGKVVNQFLEPLRQSYYKNEEWQRVDRLAYSDVEHKAAVNGH